jgi:hypothetical protein
MFLIKHRTRLLLLGAAFMLLLPSVLISLKWYLQPGWLSFRPSGEVSENWIIVRRGGDLQAAIDRARPGDTITLEAGATFTGAFVLPNKPGSEFITIRSSAKDSELPEIDQRIEPKKFARSLPRIVSNIKGSPAILASRGAHHFRFVAVEFGPTIEGLYNIIQIGTGEEKSVTELPHHLEFDRVFIHGDPIIGQRRGIAGNGRNIKIENSYISDIKRKGEESQAIAVWATDGPVEIINNYLEAAAENVLFGGAGSVLKLVPTNCIVRDNYLNKPIEWRTEGWVVKNLFEIKNGKDIKIENNLMTHNWAMGQDGTAVLFTTRADNGINSLIEDIDFAGNIVRGAGGGLNIYGAEGGGGKRLSIRNNLFENLDAKAWGSSGHFMKVTAWDGLQIENNTILQSGNIASAYGTPVDHFVFRNNIVFENEYGIKGDNMGSGQSVIDFFFSSGTVSHNIIIGGRTSNYKERNFFPTSLDKVGFADLRAGDYRLSSNSPYFNQGANGAPIGSQLVTANVGSRNKTIIGNASLDYPVGSNEINEHNTNIRQGKVTVRFP